MTPIDAIAIPRGIADALTTASRETGAGFDYLLKTAIRESGLDPGAKAPTSTATGLFQFIEQTWLQTVKEAGPRHGLAAFAGNISVDAGGRYDVADPAAKAEILALRDDPLLASIMAGELTAANRDEVAAGLGRQPSDGELYIGHFLGSKGAVTLITAAGSEPATPAADLFPAAARANPSIFYGPDGAKRGAGEVYERLVRHHGETTVPPDRREEVTPFFGIIAFFERLFGGGPESRPAPPAARTAYNLFGAAPFAGNDVDQLQSGTAALAGRIATDAYQARVPVESSWTMPADDAATDERPQRPTFAEAPWAGGLFTNAERTGPLVPIGLRDPI